MSPLSNVQFSRVCEFEAAKLFTFGSGGGLEVALPMTDDERRDLELHLKEHFRICLACQVKARHVLVRHNRADLLVIRFDEKKTRLIADPFFWYFFGYMDLRTMQYRAPVFLVPSEILHRDADPRPHGDLIRFTFAASLDPTSKDRWRPWACEPAEVAKRALEFLRQQERLLSKAAVTVNQGLVIEPGTLVVGRAA
jgi:hypothetical protein